MISVKLIEHVRSRLAIDWRGIHGMQHWARVYDNGVRLAHANGADLHVVELFAVFHDSCRVSEGSDPEHGKRGAELASALRGHYFDLPDEELELLVEACRYHTAEATHAHLTVRTCFDADRLDLGRIGVMPDPALLCTSEAQLESEIAGAYRRSRSTELPENILASEYLRLAGSNDMPG